MRARKKGDRRGRDEDSDTYLVEIGANEMLLFIRFSQSWPVLNLLTRLAQNENHSTIRGMILACLHIDIFVEFKGYFVCRFSSLLYALDGDSRGSQVDFGILKINCVDGEVDYILFFIGFAAALGPENYPALASRTQKAVQSKSG